MRAILSIFAALFVLQLSAQISKGSNFVTLGNTMFNEPIKRFDQYPDTSVTNDSSTATGVSVSIMLNYQIALSDHFAVGFKSRFLADKESTYGISAFGPSVRYYFGFGPDEPRPKMVKEEQESPGIYPVHRFYLDTSGKRLKSFFFVDGNYLFGKMKFNETSTSYNEAGLMAGIMLRAATPKTQLIRHFGVEFAAGAIRVTDPMGNSSILPNFSAGVNIFLDKKYTSHRKILRVVKIT